MSDKAFFRIAVVISLVVFAAVVMLNRKLIAPPTEIPSFVPVLPAINATINGTCSLLLLLSFYFIRKKNIRVHRNLNFLTFLLSSLFLVSYVIYHFFAPETSYGGEGALKVFYYFILITHIILAAVILPLILMSFYYGVSGNVVKHRKITRYSFPVWLYVTVSGVVVYLMISPYYPW